jgi:transposase
MWPNPYGQLLRKVNGLVATNIVIPAGIFNFCGQTKVDTFAIDLDSLLNEQRAYDTAMVNKYRLSLEAIRLHANEFSYWQRRKNTGRPPVCERDLLIAFLVRQLFNATFRETEGLLTMLADYFDLDDVPDHSVLCKKNANRRWLVLWKRFFSYVLELLPTRTIVAATDASGFSGRKQSWRETDYPVKANQDWVKIHAVIEVDQFFVLNYCLTESNVHDSQMFSEVWNGLPDNVQVKRSLADSAYHGESCLQAALAHGAIPLHGIKKNARHFPHPVSAYERMTHFWQHWPNRAAALYGKRNHAETVFSMIQRLFGYRLRCRTEIGRKNEVQAKVAMYNLFLLARKWIGFGN